MTARFWRKRLSLRTGLRWFLGRLRRVFVGPGRAGGLGVGAGLGERGQHLWRQALLGRFEQLALFEPDMFGERLAKGGEAGPGIAVTVGDDVADPAVVLEGAADQLVLTHVGEGREQERFFGAKVRLELVRERLTHGGPQSLDRLVDLSRGDAARATREDERVMMVDAQVS